MLGRTQGVLLTLERLICPPVHLAAHSEFLRFHQFAQLFFARDILVKMEIRDEVRMYTGSKTPEEMSLHDTVPSPRSLESFEHPV